MNTEYDYLIVGAGLFGATFAYFAKRHGKKCLIIDKRPHVGGNVYCDNICGINVHKYGAHIFHTSDKRIWSFVNSIVPFNRYTNSPVAFAPNGKLFNLPFNMNTFYQMWGVRSPSEAEAILNEQRSDVLKKLNGKEPSNLEEQALSLIGKDIYEQLINGYTEKQWGRDCKDLPADIIKRLPVRMVFDNNYFNDLYQGIPIGGYNKLIEGLLEGVEVRLNCDYFSCKNTLDQIANQVIYTGPIDQFFNYSLGRLQYRSVSFEMSTLDIPNFQGNAVINFTSKDVPYTRIIEHKHFEMFGSEVYSIPKTIISKEYSTEWNEDIEPYYPINDTRNSNLNIRYQELAKSLPVLPDGSSKYIMGGRLAEYKYYDMAPVIASAISAWEKLNKIVIF